MKPFLFAIALLFSGAVYADSTAFKGRVIRVADGDSITVQVSRQEKYKVRLGAIDAPERRQAFGNASRKALAKLVAGETVLVDFYKIDKYGRFIARVLINGKDAGLSQVQAGMAWHFKRFADEQSRDDQKAYEQAESSAREASRGLWSEANPMAPWDYRQNHRKNRN